VTARYGAHAQGESTMYTRVATSLSRALALAGGLLLALPQPALAAGPGGAEGGAGGLNPLNFRGDLAIWTAVVFLLLLAVLGRYAWGPIVQGLEKREQGIADQVAQAEQNNQQARDLVAQYEQKLVLSEAEIRKMLEQARRDAEEAGRQIMEKAKEEAGIERQRALREIEAAVAGALKELSDYSATLAVELAGKIVGAELKPADHARLIAQAVAEMSRARAGANGNP
jgi:F-type H+-transporting ATPase subunit b